MKNPNKIHPLVKECLGEALGTCILVLFGCGSIALAVLFKGLNSLFEVALIWGLGVALAIYCTRNICPAHLNPAVSLAMAFVKKLSFSRLPWYITSQVVGAFIAGNLILWIFHDAIERYEKVHHILRGSADSIQTALMFGEFFPNPAFAEQVQVTAFKAFTLEGLGTFLLVFTIFRLTEKPRQIDNITPLFIGLTVTLLICLIAPFTQAGINPARDFGPRMVAYWGGWGAAAFPSSHFGFFTVYILGPFTGGVLAALVQVIFRGRN